VYILIRYRKSSSLFVEITDKEDQKAYNIADTTPTAEDELITEQNLSQLLQFIKELKNRITKK
jgi:RNA polymerase sigma-70 factor (ECF subfamily)